MKGYQELAKFHVFSMKDVEDLTGNKKSAASFINRLVKRNLVKKIRKNMYSCVNVATEDVIATKYQIACASSETAYLSHHTAFEYYGTYNQMFYEVYVSSESRFQDYEYENNRYKYVESRLRDGVVEPNNFPGMRVTDLERTVVDGIKDFEKIAGIEELLNCLSMVPRLNADKLARYLDGYGMPGLYQKAGYLLEYYMEELPLPKDFIKYCRKKAGNKRCCLTKDLSHIHVYDSKWGLVVPQGLFTIFGQEG